MARKRERGPLGFGKKRPKDFQATDFSLNAAREEERDAERQRQIQEKLDKILPQVQNPSPQVPESTSESKDQSTVAPGSYVMDNAIRDALDRRNEEGHDDEIETPKVAPTEEKSGRRSGRNKRGQDKRKRDEAQPVTNVISSDGPPEGVDPETKKEHVAALAAAIAELGGHQDLQALAATKTRLTERADVERLGLPSYDFLHQIPQTPLKAPARLPRTDANDSFTAYKSTRPPSLEPKAPKTHDELTAEHEAAYAKHAAFTAEGATRGAGVKERQKEYLKRVQNEEEAAQAQSKIGRKIQLDYFTSNPEMSKARADMIGAYNELKKVQKHESRYILDRIHPGRKRVRTEKEQIADKLAFEWGKKLMEFAKIGPELKAKSDKNNLIEKQIQALTQNYKYRYAKQLEKNDYYKKYKVIDDSIEAQRGNPSLIEFVRQRNILRGQLIQLTQEESSSLRRYNTAKVIHNRDLYILPQQMKLEAKQEGLNERLKDKRLLTQIGNWFTHDLPKTIVEKVLQPLHKFDRGLADRFISFMDFWRGRDTEGEEREKKIQKYARAMGVIRGASVATALTLVSGIFAPATVGIGGFGLATVVGARSLIGGTMGVAAHGDSGKLYDKHIGSIRKEDHREAARAELVSEHDLKVNKRKHRLGTRENRNKERQRAQIGATILFAGVNSLATGVIAADLANLSAVSHASDVLRETTKAASGSTNAAPLTFEYGNTHGASHVASIVTPEAHAPAVHAAPTPEVPAAHPGTTPSATPESHPTGSGTTPETHQPGALDTQSSTNTPDGEHPFVNPDGSVENTNAGMEITIGDTVDGKHITNINEAFGHLGLRVRDHINQLGYGDTGQYAGRELVKLLDTSPDHNLLLGENPLSKFLGLENSHGSLTVHPGDKLMLTRDGLVIEWADKARPPHTLIFASGADNHDVSDIEKFIRPVHEQAAHATTPSATRTSVSHNTPVTGRTRIEPSDVLNQREVASAGTTIESPNPDVPTSSDASINTIYNSLLERHAAILREHAALNSMGSSNPGYQAAHKAYETHVTSYNADYNQYESQLSNASSAVDTSHSQSDASTATPDTHSTPDTSTVDTQTNTPSVITNITHSEAWSHFNNDKSLEVFTYPAPNGSEAESFRDSMFSIMRESGVGPVEGESIQQYVARAAQAIQEHSSGAQSTLDIHPAIYETSDHHLVVHGGDLNSRLLLARKYIEDINPQGKVAIENPGHPTPLIQYPATTFQSNLNPTTTINDYAPATFKAEAITTSSKVVY